MPKLYPGYRDEIQKKIVGTAAEYFLAKGFERTTMEEIAASLGVTKPALYRYYKNKDELFFAVVTEIMMTEFNRIFSVSFKSDDLNSCAELFFDAILELEHKYPMMAQDVDYVFSRNESFRKGIFEMITKGLQPLQEFFETQKRKGNIKTDIEADDLAILCGSLSTGLTHNVAKGMDPVQAKRIWLLGFSKLTCTN